jgi:selenocysteine lyase/cysteine desulfurase
VDASQSAGNGPIDVQDWKGDILAFTGHKSLFGLPGTGCLYLCHGVELRPLKVGGTGIRSDLLFQPQELPLLLESGTPNLPGIAALAAGVEYILATGVEAIRKRKRELVRLAVGELLSHDTIRVYAQETAAQKATVFSFNVGDKDPAEFGYLLENAFGIIVRSGLHCAPLIHQNLGSFPLGSIRVSPSFFTSPDEMLQLVSAVGETLTVEAVL